MATEERDEMAELEAKLAAARDARSVKSKAGDDARKLKQLQEEVRLLDFEATEGELDVDIKALFSPKDGSMIVVRTPKPVVHQRFQEKVLSDKPVTTRDLYDLIHASLVYPSKKDFEKICESAPGMLSSAANAVQELAGASKEGVAGK